MGTRSDLWIFLGATSIALLAALASTIRALPRRSRRLSLLLFATVWTVCSIGLLSATSIDGEEALVAVWTFVVLGLGAGSLLVAAHRNRPSQKTLI